MMMIIIIIIIKQKNFTVINIKHKGGDVNN